MATIKVYLSPSNQFGNIGENGYNEAKEMRKLSEDIKYFLDMNQMFLTKISSPQMSLEEVITDSNDFHSTLHLCLHTDAFDKNADGTTVFVYSTTSQSNSFAKVLYEKISKVSPGSDQGIQVRPGLIELRGTKCPAVLIENFFHTNKIEVDFYYNHQQLYALQIANSLYQYYEIPFTYSPEYIIMCLLKLKLIDARYQDHYLKLLKNEKPCINSDLKSILDKVCKNFMIY